MKGRSMNLKLALRRILTRQLSGDLKPALLGNFDMERRAETNPFTRKTAYGAAFAVFNEFPDNPLYGDQRVWEMALRMFDIVADLQCDDGDWARHIPATGKTHRTPYFTEMYSWMRFFEDFGARMDAGRRDRMGCMLRRAADARMTRTEGYLDTGVHAGSKNIFLSGALTLWMAGRLFAEPAWVRTAEKALDSVIATQSSEGYWYDGNVPRGPTVGYNSVTLEAVSVYARLSGNRQALDAVHRGARFHRAFAYPDGTDVETIDERNRYTPVVNGRLVWAFAPFEATRPIAAFFADNLQQRTPDPGRHGSLGAVEFDAWQATPDAEIAAGGFGDGIRVFSTIPAVIVNQGPWTRCLSGATTALPSGHFHHDLQNHVSLWHRSLGLVVGGGNSLFDPTFSTFRFHDRHLAQDGEAEADANGARLRLRYGDIRASVALSVVNGREVRLEACAEGPLPEDSEFAFHLYGRHGDRLRLGEHDCALDDLVLWHGLVDDNRHFAVGPIEVTADRDFAAMWPCIPVNIYDPPRRLALEHAVLRVFANLSKGPVKFLIQVTG